MRHMFAKNFHHCWIQSSLIYLGSIIVLVLCNHGLANVVHEDNQRTSACIPCSATYLAADPNYPNILSNISVSTESCESLLSIVKVLKFPNLYRSLEGEGSHRSLILKLQAIESDSSSAYLDGFNCELVSIETLNGVFADPFELQRLVINRRVYLDAAVFGDSNLELPAALSKSSVVEIHMDLVPSSTDKLKMVIDLPLHVRYPPLDSSGYSNVEISQPDLYIRCRKKGIAKDCQWGVSVIEVESTETVNWLIPCGDDAHSTVVSSVTFLSALICALSIVFASIFYHPTI
ncbi:Phosphatidylinositol-glycan biosynthesis class X protein [Rhynchospora pubera]|uniref:Phosphatidylinositol-glycan biosynthesis class X protein n=1 Tax=Rhynchospora pubera TaxID=906938 RepID=A0AAV8GYN1_9POAL|nr:Phosphatidylinositol-glycan biosynthesis class X protein [Rhynchospora pubera]